MFYWNLLKKEIKNKIRKRISWLRSWEAKRNVKAVYYYYTWQRNGTSKKGASAIHYAPTHG